MKQFFITLFSLLLITPAYAGFPVIEGQLVDNFGAPVRVDDVDFRIQVYSQSQVCMLAEEVFNDGGGGPGSGYDLEASAGSFSLLLGSGASLNIPGANANYSDVFAADASGAGNSCTTSIMAGENREIMVAYSTDSGTTWNPISAPVIYGGAGSAATLDGFRHSSFLKINEVSPTSLSQSNLEWVFESARYAELQALINGTSSQYMTSSPSSSPNFNGQVVDNIAAPVDANDATNKNYVDTKIGGQNADALISAPTVAQDGHVLSWNNTTSKYELVPSAAADNLGNHTATANIQTGANFISNDGAASQGLSFDGSNNAAFSQNLSVSQGFSVTNGINSGGSINVANEGELQLAEATGSGTNYIALKAPSAVTGNVTLTLPDGDGAANQVLGTDGSGNLQWQNDQNVGAIASVFGRTGPVVSANGDYNAGQITNTAAGNIAAVTVQAAVNELDSEKLAIAGGAMTGDLTLNAQNDVRLGDSGSNYAAIQAPATITTNYTLTLPTDDGAASEVLQTDGAGVLSWVAIPSAPVTTVHGRAGPVVSANGDYNASQITNTAAGNIAAVTVQAAIDELDSEKLALAGGTMTGHLITDSAVQIHADSGSASAPSYSFDGDNDTGIFLPAAGNIGFANNGNQRMVILANGHVGIGVANPSEMLEVNGKVAAQEICDEAGVNCHDISSGWTFGASDINGLGDARVFGVAADASVELGPRSSTLYSGTRSVAVGTDALRGAAATPGAISNVAVGWKSMETVEDDADNNTAVGSESLTSIDDGKANTAIGDQALKAVESTMNNAALGAYAGMVATGSNNTFLGTSAGDNIVGGDSNIFIGRKAGTNVTSGNSNILIGNNVAADNATGSSQLNIGNLYKGDMGSGEAVIDGNLSIIGGKIRMPQQGSLGPCDNTNVDIIKNVDEGNFHCFFDGTNYHWVPMSAGPVKCPGGFSLVGDPGKSSSFCIHTNSVGETVPGDERGYLDAQVTCEGLAGGERGHAHLCTPREWRAACLDAANATPAVVNMTTGGSELVDAPFFSGVAKTLVFGNGDCDTFGETANTTAPHAYRCCID